ncbi:MAG: hypothetical protein Q7S32_01525 [bacterium]|nr:hypothetical protein [bacterium]
MRKGMFSLLLAFAFVGSVFGSEKYDRQETVYALQAPFGDGASVVLILNNDTGENQPVRLIFWSGRDLVDVLVDGKEGSPYASSPEYVLKADEKRYFLVTASGPVRFGRIEIANNGGITGSVSREFEGADYRTLLSRTSNREMVKGAGYTSRSVTGVVLTNANSLPGADADVTLRVFDDAGLLVTEKKLDRLEAASQRAVLLHQLLKGDPSWEKYLALRGEFRGSLEFKADGVFFAVAAINLRY